MSELEHHIAETTKLIEHTRFEIQAMQEKLSFATGDLWLVLERLKSIMEQSK